MISATSLFFALAAAGPSPEPAAGATDVEATLDPARRRLQGNQVAIDLAGGSLGGRAVGQTFLATGRLTYYPIRHLGIAAAYGFSRGIGGLDTVRHTSVHYVDGQLELPLASALRVGKNRVLQMDLFGEVGAGAAYVAHDWRALGVIGGGVRLYPRVPWLAIRIDALTFMHETRRATGKAFDADIGFTLGLSVLLPSGSGT